MSEVLFSFSVHLKGDPSGVRNPAVFLGKTFCQEHITNRAREGDVHDPANMHVSNFCFVEAEFTSPETMCMNGHVRPRRNFVFQLFRAMLRESKLHTSVFDDPT